MVVMGGGCEFPRFDRPVFSGLKWRGLRGKRVTAAGLFYRLSFWDVILYLSSVLERDLIVDQANRFSKTPYPIAVTTRAINIQYAVLCVLLIFAHCSGEGPPPAAIDVPRSVVALTL
jgi:hypothetical protein